MYFGVYFGDQRGFVFCTGRRRSQGYFYCIVLKLTISYASWDPIFWPFLRSSARDPTSKAVR